MRTTSSSMCAPHARMRRRVCRVLAPASYVCWPGLRRFSPRSSATPWHVLQRWQTVRRRVARGIVSGAPEPSPRQLRRWDKRPASRQALGLHRLRGAEPLCTRLNALTCLSATLRHRSLTQKGMRLLTFCSGMADTVLEVFSPCGTIAYREWWRACWGSGIPPTTCAVNPEASHGLEEEAGMPLALHALSTIRWTRGRQPQRPLDVTRPTASPRVRGAPRAVHVMIGVITVGVMLGGRAYGCRSPVAAAVSAGDGRRAALESYAADSADHLYPHTSMMASHADLVRIVNLHGGTLPDKEPAAATWWAHTRRRLRWLAVWDRAGYYKVYPRHSPFTFVQYTADDGRSYTLMLRVEDVPEEMMGKILVATPESMMRCTTPGRVPGDVAAYRDPLSGDPQLLKHGLLGGELLGVN